MATSTPAKRQYIKRRLNIIDVRAKYNRSGKRPPVLYNDIAKLVRRQAKTSRDLSVNIPLTDRPHLETVATMLRDDGFTVTMNVDEGQTKESGYAKTYLMISW